MRVIHTVPAIDEEASGPSYSVPALCDAIAGRGGDVHLHVLDAAQQIGRDFNLHAHGRWKVLSRLGISPRMQFALNAEADRTDIIHNHSLWMMPNVYPAWAARRNDKCRLVMSPRGTLSGWVLKRSKWKKAIVGRLFQYQALREADLIHVTSPAEMQEVRAWGLSAPVAVIPNGIDIPEQLPSARRNDYRQLLFLSRIHPKKGIDGLLKAWRKVQHRFSEWELVIAGPDNDGHLPQMEQLARDLELTRTRFIGPVFGAQKQQVYADAEVFVLPTHSENFGLVVAEALASGTPTIVSKGAPWSGLNEEGCGWWIDLGEEALIECLNRALSHSPAQLSAMGSRGRTWMQREFTWPVVGRQMFETYKWLLAEGTMPSWVYSTTASVTASLPVA